MTTEAFEPSVRRELDKWLGAAASGRRVAVFDADGTLWRGDVGEAFYQHQLEAGTIPGAPKENGWQIYFDEVTRGNAPEAYSWLARWNAGVSEPDLCRWCDEFFQAQWSRLVFEPVRALVRATLAAGVEVWVVTASPRWIVQAGARTLGIAPERVIGVSVQIEGGRLTGRLEHEVPYRAGKARLLEQLVGIPPELVAGNTYWDKEMMLTATRLALAVHSEHPGEANYESEQKLQRLASEHGWLRQRF